MPACPLVDCHTHTSFSDGHASFEDNVRAAAAAGCRVMVSTMILLGILFSGLGQFSDTIIYIGIACFGLSVVFQFATLPVEFNASHRALQTIESTGILTEEEQKGARKTLTAAAMTYVAATATALAQLLRLIVLFGRRSNNNRR